MAIRYSALKSWPFADQLTTYGRRDCILYALGLGYGSDPLDAAELPFVYEEWLKPVPTLLTVLGAPGAWASDPGTGIDWLQILHGEHRMTLHAPLAPEGTLRSRTRVARIVDKGAGRGALVTTEREVTDEPTGVRVATIEHTSFCRADGGFGESDEPPLPLPAVPQTPPDASVDLPTEPRAALLYRLNGDRNPLHVDPEAARRAGLQRPILHGLCSYGMAARAILRACCGNDPARLASLALRFSAPLFPGETLRIELWRQEGRVQFRGIAAERGTPVLTNGIATIHG
jgi:acyl dehydratase